MKKLIFGLTMLAIVATTTFMACKKHNNEYSCDEKANNYAALHKETNQSITRDSLVKFDRSTQFAIWRSLDAENRKRIFDEKIDLVLSTENLSAAEITHLNTLKSYFVPDLYELTENAFLDNWENYAKNTLGWDDNKLTLYVGIWSTQSELAEAATMAGGGSPTQNCTCAWDAGCAGFGDCQASRGGGCIAKSGCGLIGTSNCDGTCPEDVKPSGSSSTY